MTDMKDFSDLSGLDADRLELFEYLLEEEEELAAASHLQTIMPRESTPAAPPLSFAQQRLWFLDQLQPGSAAYNVAGALRMEGRLDVAALAQSLNEIIRRHEALRTTFATVDDQPVQLINASLRLTLPLVDLSELPSAKRETESQRRMKEEARRPFDLTAGPLLRAHLLRLAPQEHILLLTMHHIISDGWSVGVFIREMAALYSAYTRGVEEGSPLPEPALQYADYALWQRDWLGGDVLAEQLRFWKQQLGGNLPVLQLPTDGRRAKAQSFRAATQEFVLSGELSEGLRSLALKEDVTLFMLLLAAFQGLLSRYSGQTDILVGTPIANRTRAEVEPLIGFFVNTLVLRTDLAGDPNFKELLKRVREVCLGAYAHQELPFEKLVEELQPERSLSHGPIFQVMFALQNASARTMEWPGLRVSLLEVDTETAKFDLALEMQVTAGGIKGELQYSTDLFEPPAIERMAAHFQTLLEGILADADERLSRLPLLTPGETQELLVHWNETKMDYASDSSLHQLFEKQAEETPEATALIFEDEQLSYAELNRRANRLAHYLLGLGVGPEVCVGVMMERSVEMVVGLLGILKAGGAYVPLDPSYPQERLAFMLEDSAVAVLLAQERLLERLPEHQAKVLCLDRDWKLIESQSDENPSTAVTAASMIYIIYTSGSTGKPKGVMLAHRGVVNCLSWLQSVFHLSAGDRCMMKALLSFDASVWELFWPLMVGAGVVVARPGGQQDPAYLVRTITRHRVNVIHFVPSMLPLFLEEDEVSETTSLRYVICGGEALPAETLERFFSRSKAELHNFYGPTETSIGSIDWTSEREYRRHVVPIGRPIANTEAYVLDAAGQLAPVGVLGELYIGGDGLARGYLHHPQLTAERFIPDPFGGRAGARLYRTGDLVRSLPDGQLEFLGRTDYQVKIRGFRIELEEIEAVLSSHHAVRESLVIALEDASKDKRLVAYVVAEAQRRLSAPELRGYLGEQLPEYMVPTAFVFLDQFPVMANGKVDRRALPLPERIGLERRGSHIAPRTPVEEILAGIISDVLKVERVGAHDNFFELGGHSLLATQVRSRIRTALKVELPLRSFFEYPEIADIAVAVESLMRSGSARATPPLVPARRDEPLPLSFAQRRLWFLDQLEAGNPVYNMPAAVRLVGPCDVQALERAINEMVKRHESLRTIFRVVDGEPIQLVLPAQPINLPITDLTASAKIEREREALHLASLEARQYFDLSRGPLLRASLLRLGSDEHVLLLTMHHIISDGWSMGVLVEEVGALYSAYTRGVEEGSPLPEPALQYADYALWQRDWLQGEVLTEQLAYWRERLSVLPPVLELPADYPRPKVQTFRGASLNINLSEELTEQLRALSRREGVTLFMLLLAAFQSLLSRYSGQTDIVVGTPIANRQRSEIESLIGFFVNTLVLRTDLAGDPNFRELLKRVREVCLGAYAHQELPFEKLVEELQPGRDLSHTPLFQVMFVMQNAPGGELALPGLTLSQVDVQSGVTKFDLMLQLDDSPRGLTGVIEYSTDLFAETTIRRLLGHFETLLAGIIAGPETKLSALPLLSEAERQQLLVLWNDTETELDLEKCVPDVVEQQAALAPDAAAVIFGAQRLSYMELNSRANQLARRLRKLGVGPDRVVAIMMDRSVEMMVSVLGVLKAGGAYMPLDPEYPRERLSFMLEDAAVRAILTETRLLERLPEAAPPVICLDADWSNITRESAANPERQTSPDNLAYVTYTSGSTGKPKGVAMHHRPLINLISFQIRSSGLAYRPRTLQFSALSFDVSFQEIFSTWCAGATLVLITEDARRDARELCRTLSDARVERLFLPFVALQHLAEVAGEDETAPRSLRQVFTAGEQLKITPHIRALFGKLPQCTLDNHYGPSETHLATVLRLEGETDAWPRLPAIGRPIDNAQVFVLDEQLRPVPIGIIGELYIGGAGLAREYLNRADQTAERFIPHPFSAEAGARLYRTGDLARYQNDGRLEYLGRIDNQVKVRGFRIEIGEIESVLKLHPMVKQAVVNALEDEAGRKRLAAYIVNGREDEPVTTGELRNFLREKLPEYMVPSIFVTLDQLPLTPSGKVDRRALPAPDQSRTETEGDYIAPRTQVEEILAGIWSGVLKVEPLSIYDNFFDLGGHSLLATQVISKVREAFRLEIALRLLFEHPTVAALARSIETELSESHGASLPPIRPVTREQPLPLSFAQQRLWFLDQLEPGNASYNLSSAVDISGPLNIVALRASFTEIIRRHEILRTSFPLLDGQPVQAVSLHTASELPVVDLQALQEDEREAEVRRLALEEAQRAFNLLTGPLLRVQLLRVDIDRHVLLLTMHHIISDGWSMGVLVEEAGALYSAYTRGVEEGSPLPEPALQYADYALWQRDWLGGDVLAEQLRFWKSKLAGAPPILELPTTRPRPAVQTFRGAREEFSLSPEMTGRLKSLSRREGVTLFMLLLAAFQGLLSRYSGQTDILVGTPIANRTRAEVEPLIGFFVNTLVLRTDLAGDPNFRELLKRVREVCLGAYAHQELPFEKLVEELQPERSLSHGPIFQVMFALQNASARTMEWPGLKLISTEIAADVSRFDLTLSLEESRAGLAGVMEYNSDLFDAAAIKRMLNHYHQLLAAVTETAETRLSLLPLLTETERRQQLVEWNNTRVDEAQPQALVHRLFEKQAEETPHAAALVLREEQLTFRELNERANQLAHYLQRLGVGPETFVCICAERSIELFVAIMAVVKAGGAYVPLDPAYPAERLNFMLRDSRAEVLLTQEHLRDVFEKDVFEQSGTQRVFLDTDRERLASESVENPPSASLADNLVYVIYTSGSTGRPKGVAISHASLLNVVRWYQTAFALTPVDRTTQLAGIGFDASILEVWPNLAAGVGLYLPDDETRLSPEKLRDWFISTGITVAFVPTPLAEPLLALDWPTETALRAMQTGGEQLHRFPEPGLGFQVTNNYGPTENTVIVTIESLKPQEDTQRLPPIGRPVANVQVYLLDQYGQPVPIGVTGELYVGGVQLARGYLNEPGLTAEKFVPHPFSEVAGARLYRTGDLARYLPDGRMEFLGRLDHQVKIRGHRIELGEIESVLGEHPAVHETIVLSRADEPGEKRLVAYLVFHEGAAADARELRGWLSERLPEYMLPAFFISLDQLPLNPNGKLDRQALPAPDATRPELKTAYAAPLTEMERIICGIWQDLLGLKEIGTEDNFFELGGHSLLLVRVQSSLASRLKRKLTITEMFKYPTISALARHLGSEPREESGESPQRRRADARRASLKARERLKQ